MCACVYPLAAPVKLGAKVDERAVQVHHGADLALNDITRLEALDGCAVIPRVGAGDWFTHVYLLSKGELQGGAMPPACMDNGVPPHHTSVCTHTFRLVEPVVDVLLPHAVVAQCLEVGQGHAAFEGAQLGVGDLCWERFV